MYLPILTGPDGTSNVTLRTGGATNSGQLSITAQCKDPAKLLSFYDLWYIGENVMQLQYGPIGVFFTEKNEKGQWKSITDEEARAKFLRRIGITGLIVSVVVADYYFTALGFNLDGPANVGFGVLPVAFAASVNIATMVVVATPIIVSVVALVKGIRIRRQIKKQEN